MSLQARADMELWDRPFQTLLVAVIAFNILAHVGSVPTWVLIGSLTALTWKMLHLYRGFRLPPRFALFILGSIAGIGIFFTYGTALGNEAATPLLVFLASLKLLETNRDRDAMFVILTGYFLLMAHLLNSQSLASTFFMALDVALITLLMYQLHRSDRHLSRASIRPVARYLLLTIPIWLALFVVFPRFTLSLSRSQAQQPSVGFSEEIDSGTVSQLVETNELAFRVKFQGRPDRGIEDLYWRGAVLYSGQDFRWKPENEATLLRFKEPLPPNPTDSPVQNAVTYEVTLEPSAGNTLFSLPKIVGFSAAPSLIRYKPYLTSFDVPRLEVRHRERVQYSASSIIESLGSMTSLSERERVAATLVPSATSDRLTELANRLRPSISISQGAAFTIQATARIQDYFAEKGFRYSLKLPGGKLEKIDDFIFERRVGFCEHYAAASTTLLRLMGVPARIAVGYLGGRYNQLSRSYLVRSRDAHAWVEVWQPSKADPNQGRWMTFDPTALIIPLRRQLGGDFYDLPEEQQTASTTPEQALKSLNRNVFSSIAIQTELVWDYAQMTWSNFLLNYDSSGQRAFINSIVRQLGLTYSPGLVLALMCVLLIIVSRTVFLLKSRQAKGDRLQLEWARLCAELDRLRIRVRPSDGPLTLLERSQNEPDIARAIEKWIDVQYGPSSTEKNQTDILSVLKIAIRRARRLRELPSSP